MSIERGKDLLAGIFANYGIDINTWATYSPEKQQQMKSEYTSKQLNDQPPYEAQYGPDTGKDEEGIISRNLSGAWDSVKDTVGGAVDDVRGFVTDFGEERSAEQERLDAQKKVLAERSQKKKVDALATEQEGKNIQSGMEGALNVPDMAKLASDKAKSARINDSRKRLLDRLVSHPLTYDPVLPENLDAKLDSALDAPVTSDLAQEGLERPSFMSQRKWDAIPVSQRRKVLENIRKTEEKAAIKGEVGREASHILSAASPISWVNPDENKYTIGGGVDTKVRGLMGLDNPKDLKEEEERTKPPGFKTEGLIEETLKKEKKAIAESTVKPTLDAKKKATNVTGDFIKFAQGGYPVYKKGSKWGNSFSDRHAKAVADGEKVFSWKGHDGKTRKYTNEKAADTIKDAPKVKEGENAGYDPLSGFGPAQISTYKAAKTQKEKEKVLVDLKPEQRAAVKEQIDNYWVDPRTGYALNLSKVGRRANAMQLANLMPAADRAAFLYSREIIDKSDFDAMMKPTDAEALTRKLKLIELETANLELVGAKIKNADPRRAEKLKMYLNAGSNNNYELQSYLGGELGLSKEIMDNSAKRQRAYELAKLSSKSSKGNLKKRFAEDFGVEYSTYVDDKQLWIRNATSMIQEKGQFTEFMTLNGTKTVDRGAQFRSYSLYEQEAMKLRTPEEQLRTYKRSPYYERMIKNSKYQGSDGNFDPTLLTNDKENYERYLLDNLVYLGMDDAYSNQNMQIMKYIAKNSFNQQKEDAELAKNITASATSSSK